MRKISFLKNDFLFSKLFPSAVDPGCCVAPDPTWRTARGRLPGGGEGVGGRGKGGHDRGTAAYPGLVGAGPHTFFPAKSSTGGDALFWRGGRGRGRRGGGGGGQRSLFSKPMAALAPTLSPTIPTPRLTRAPFALSLDPPPDGGVLRAGPPPASRKGFLRCSQKKPYAAPPRPAGPEPALWPRARPPASNSEPGLRAPAPSPVAGLRALTSASARGVGQVVRNTYYSTALRCVTLA